MGEYPDFYIALPAYGVGEKRMYAQKLRALLARDNPKKKIGVMFTSVRVHGKKGLCLLQQFMALLLSRTQ